MYCAECHANIVIKWPDDCPVCPYCGHEGPAKEYPPEPTDRAYKLLRSLWICESHQHWNRERYSHSDYAALLDALGVPWSVQNRAAHLGRKHYYKSVYFSTLAQDDELLRPYYDASHSIVEASQ